MALTPFIPILKFRQTKTRIVFPVYSSLFSILVFLNSSIFSNWAHDRAGTEAFSFLSKTSAATVAGLAGASTAMTQGTDALNENPAGLIHPEKGNWLSAGYRYNFLTTHTGKFSYLFSDSQGTVYAISLDFAHFGGVEEINDEGIKSGQTHFPSNHTPALHVAKRFSRNFRTGISLKIPTEYLGGFEQSQWALGWAFDLGLQFQPKTKRLSLGAALLNAGKKEIAHLRNGERGGALPLLLKAGITYYSLSLKHAAFVLDLNFPYHYSPYLNGGVEYTVSPYFTLRAGGRFNLPEFNAFFKEFVLGRDHVNPDRSAIKAAGGFSLNQKAFIIDYAIQYWHWLGSVHWVTVKWRL